MQLDPPILPASKVFITCILVWPQYNLYFGLRSFITLENSIGKNCVKIRLRFLLFSDLSLVVVYEGLLVIEWVSSVLCDAG